MLWTTIATAAISDHYTRRGDFKMQSNWLYSILFVFGREPCLPLRSPRFFTLGLGAAILLSLCAHSAFAQVSASIIGVVTDPSAAQVPSASISVKNHETGAARTTITDAAGRYSVLALPVGEYEVKAAKQGFQDAIHSGLHLVVGPEANGAFRLQLSGEKTEINVSGDAPMVSVTTQDISGLVSEQALKDLPLNGRSYDLLLPLNPGIVNFTSQKTGGTGISNSSTANNFSVSSNRPQQNIF